MRCNSVSGAYDAVDVVAGLLLALVVVRASRYWSLPIGRDHAR